MKNSANQHVKFFQLNDAILVTQEESLDRSDESEDETEGPTARLSGLAGSTNFDFPVSFH